MGEVLSFPDSPSLYISVEVTVPNSETSYKGSSQHRAGHTAVLKRWLLITPCYQPTSTASCQPMGGTCRATDGWNYYNDSFFYVIGLFLGLWQVTWPSLINIYLHYYMFQIQICVLTFKTHKKLVYLFHALSCKITSCVCVCVFASVCNFFTQRS